MTENNNMSNNNTLNGAKPTFREFFGLQRSTMGLLTMVVLLGIGEKMTERFLPVYFEKLHAGIILIGLYAALTNNLLPALYSFPGGYLTEKFGARRALFIFNCIAIAGFLVVIVFPHRYALLIGSFMFLSWTAISLPASMEIVSRVLPKNKRTMGVSVHSFVRRIPMALGPLAGGYMIDRWGKEDGVRYAFVVALAMAIFALFMQQKLIENTHKPPGDGTNIRRLWLLLWKNKSLKNLLVSDILIRFCEQIPYVFVVFWCMYQLTWNGVTPEHMDGVPERLSGVQFGVLTAIEMITATVIYIPVAYFADKSQKKPFVVATFAFFTLFPLALLFCNTFWLLVPAFILRGLKEFGEPTRKALILDLAPTDCKAGMFGLYYLIRDVVVSLGAFGGCLLWMICPAANFLGAFAFGLCGTIWFAIRGKDLSPQAHAEKE